MEYYSAIKRNEIELFAVRWVDLESVIQSEVSQKEKNKYRTLTHIYMEDQDLNRTVLTPAPHMPRRAGSPRPEVDGLGISSFLLPFCPPLFPCFLPIYLPTLVLNVYSGHSPSLGNLQLSGGCRGGIKGGVGRAEMLRVFNQQIIRVKQEETF